MGNREKTARLFIGFPLSEEVRTRIIHVCDLIKKRDYDIRWVRKENMHVTVKFLGDTPEVKIPEISRVMKGVSSYMPFEMEIGGIGAFSSLASARVIWVGAYDESGTVNKIYKEVEFGIKGLGFKKEKRSYTPHITVGRSRKRPVCLNGIEQLPVNDERITMQISELLLYRSKLGSGGAEYTVVERVTGKGPENTKAQRGCE